MTLDVWLSVVPHDLRRPLTLIIGYADKLRHHVRTSRDSPQRVDKLELIHLAAYRLDKMLTQIVDGARLRRDLGDQPRALPGS